METRGASEKGFCVATEINECYGQGSYGKEEHIVRTKLYNHGDFPPVFESREDAEEWIKSRKFNHGLVVVSLPYMAKRK